MSTAKLLIVACWTVSILVAFTAARPVDERPDRAAETTGWHVPHCSSILGTAAVTYTRDQGRRLTPTVDELRGVVLTRGLVALDTPDTLIASPLGEDPSSTRPAFLRSTDAGCSWSPMGTSQSQPPPTLVAAPGGRAYAWTFSPPHLSVIAGDVVEDLPLPAAVSAIRGFAVDAADPDQLALGDRDGVVWRSTDGGHSWSEIGTKPPSNDPFLPIVHRVAFDPHDLDHVMVGMSSTGAFVSGDGGRTWIRSRGFSRSPQKGATVFEVVFSPVTSAVVWASGIDFAEADRGADGRHVYRSTDGGITFKPVVNRSRSVTIVNGPLMVAHPTNANVLYFVFGFAPSGTVEGGTDLYRYDARTKRVTKTHNAYHNVGAIAFNPSDPNVMYLGLEIVERHQP